MLIDISTWWHSIAFTEKILWIIALLFSGLFILQTILTLSGVGDDITEETDDYSGNDEGVSYQYFTIKNMIAFFTMFGWAGLAAYHGGVPVWGLVLVATTAGALMVLMMAVLLNNISRLRHSGTLNIQNALHQSGETYLIIPPSRSGLGKVHIRVQGSLHELQAMTDDPEHIPTGKPVKVTGVINDSILLVTAQFYY